MAGGEDVESGQVRRRVGDGNAEDYTSLPSPAPSQVRSCGHCAGFTLGHVDATASFSHLSLSLRRRRRQELPSASSVQVDGGPGGEETDELCDHVHHSSRAPWLRAFVLGANDGLVSVASLLMGVGAGSSDLATLRLSGVAGLVGGALSMAVGAAGRGGEAGRGGDASRQQRVLEGPSSLPNPCLPAVPSTNI